MTKLADKSGVSASQRCLNNNTPQCDLDKGERLKESKKVFWR